VREEKREQDGEASVEHGRDAEGNSRREEAFAIEAKLGDEDERGAGESEELVPAPLREKPVVAALGCQDDCGRVGRCV
jgi:hypothetical protein